MPQTISEQYELRRSAASAAFTQQNNAASRYGFGVVAALLLGIAAGWNVVRHDTVPQLLAVAAVAIGVLIYFMLRARGAAEREGRLVAIYERGLNRLSGEVTQSGFTGEAFAEQGHLYERDLDVLGEDSLFGLLATTRTAIGQRALAQILLRSVDAGTARQRQQAVQELAPNLALREKVALLGQSQFQDLPADKFDLWLAVEQDAFPGWVRIFLWLTVAAWLSLLTYGLWQHVDTTVLVHNIGAIFMLQGAVALWFRNRVRLELEPAERLMGQVTILRNGLRLLRESQMGAERLQVLQQQAGGEDQALAELQRHLLKVQQRSNEWCYLPALAVCLGTQSAISLNRWKQRYAKAMGPWLDAWAEFEALLAIATYAVEHEENVYPQVVESPTALFEARGMTHPLLWRERAVANDVSFGDDVEFLLISGSNMAGKSTLLRAIGANAVLALAGAPVPATAMTLSALRVGASLAITDSLAEGKSKFLAEVERLRDLVALAKANPANSLFLIDEILSGTNSADRRAAAEAVLRGLIREGAIGALSTHDLALAELAEMPDLGGRNVHMASPDESDPLGFDYLLKPGVNRSTNALAIVKMLGLAE